MALSYYSNCSAFQHLDSEPTMIEQLLSYPDYNQIEAFPDYQLFDPDDLFYSSENPNSGPLLPDEFPSDNNCHKIQKICDHDQICYSSDQFINKPAFMDADLVQNPNYLTLRDYYYDSPSENLLVSPTLPDFPTGPPSYSKGSCGNVLKKKETTSAAGDGGRLSAQSISARQRRRKISEKTHELGNLVPGGEKMNTAEMLRAAYKYIKFLQAQVGVLHLIDSYRQGNQEALESDDDLQVLLESPMMQENLYSTEKCLVPMIFVPGN